MSRNTARRGIAVLGRCLVALALITLIASNASATLIELRFSETQMPLGTTSAVVPLLGGEYNSFGIDATNAYRYIDSRDPFSDGAENLSGSPFGLSLNSTTSPARIDFLSPVANLEVDWWTINSTIFLDVFDTGGALIHSFNGVGSGTESILASMIGSLEWHDTEGFVQISNIRFDTDNAIPVPEPSTLALFVIALAGLGFMARRRVGRA